MKLGGRIVYHGALGKHSSMLVEYLEVSKHLLQCSLLLKLQHRLHVHVELAQHCRASANVRVCAGDCRLSLIKVVLINCT